MARPLRIEFPGAFYHVMNRGNNKNPIFYKDYDRRLFLKTLGDAVRLWKIRIHAYSLMDNHYHLLVETPLGNISRAMRHIDGVYTQRFNRSWKRDGSLLRGRFKSIVIDKETYFLELVRYIHLNGVRALITPSPEFDIHCSHPHYLNGQKRPSWLSTELALSFFGDQEVQIPNFDAFVKRGISLEIQNVLDKKHWPAVLGNKSFVNSIKDTYLKLRKKDSEKPQEKLLRRLFSVEEILGTVFQVFGVDAGILKKRAEKRFQPARQAAIYFLRHAGNLGYAEIGEVMGGISRGPISRICLTERIERKEILSQRLGEGCRDKGAR